MALTKILFEDVCNFSQGGIKKLYLSNYVNKSSPYYPLNYYVTGTTISRINETMTFKEIVLDGNNAIVKQTRTIDQQGKWFNKELSFTVSKIHLQTHRFFNALLFKRDIVNSSGVARPMNLDNYNTTAIFLDMNDNWWITGYDLPLKITKFEITTGSQGQENKYDLAFSSRSYDRIRKIIPIITCDGISYTAS